jgi:hypothetical protein
MPVCSSCPLLWLLDFFRDPAGDGGDQFTWGETGRLCDQPVLRAADGQCTAFHQRAIAVEGHSFGRHRTELFEHSRILGAGALGEAGLGRSRTEARYGDAGVVQFVGDRLRERNHISFGGIVDRHERAGLESRGGPDIHDPTAATPHHRRQEKPGEFGECRDVELNLSEDFFLGHLREISEGSEAGVVDEDINGNALALKLVEKKLRCGRSGEIKRDGLNRDAVSLQLRGDLRELVRAASDKHQVVMIASEELGEFVSEAAGGTGDKHGGHADILAGFT